MRSFLPWAKAGWVRFGEVADQRQISVNRVPVILAVMTIDERIERLTERVEGLVMTAELHQRELQTDAENIRALARIAEIHERRLEIESGQS